MKPNQSAFIKDRLLLENVLLATELVKDYHKDNISPRCAFKIDITKAFDTVNWDFIIDTFKAMRIPDIFIHWIRGCISIASFSVNINGELEGFFTSTRGLRQGSSLSPLLFVVARNVLTHWMWKKILRLRPIAANIMKSEVISGAQTSFWYDHWLDLGPLIKLTGEIGTQRLGVRKNATVTDVVDNEQWNLRHCRDSSLKIILERIRAHPVPQVDAGEDVLVWKQDTNRYEHKFATKRTWDLIRTARQEVVWSKLVWFSQALPRQSFIIWLAFKNRLSTGDRAQAWGHSHGCLLCGEPNESRDHLFFACPYSFTVWMYLMDRILGAQINPDWSRTIQSLRNNHLSKADSTLAKMAFQATIYWIWRERNGRRHSKPTHSPTYLAHTINKEMQHRLQALGPAGNSLVTRWAAATTIPQA